MGATHSQPEILVRIEENGKRARMIIPAGFPEEYLDPSLLLLIVEGRGVVIDDQVRRRIEEALERYREKPELLDVVIAEWSPAVHGEDGRFEWMPGYDPTLRQRDLECPESGDPDRPIDHYNQIRYIHVKAGAHVATILPPTRGISGRDVRGEEIPAKIGRPTFLQCDRSLSVDADGRTVARHDGVLQLERGVASVIRFLEVRDFADFSTGNINFDGRVQIRRGVRDRFTVRATEDIIVDGLVESAVIHAGRDFTLRTGMTGRDTGRIQVGRHATAVYLNQVRGTVGGNLTILRELMGCRLNIHGNLIAPRATIIGGETRVGGNVEIGTIGSDAAIETIVEIGCTDTIDMSIAGLRREHEAVEMQWDDRSRRRDPHAGAYREQLDAIELQLQELEHERGLRQRATLQVMNRIMPRAVLHVGGRIVRFTDALSGPVWIGVNSEGDPIYRCGSGSSHPLSEVARDSRAAA